MRLSHKERAKRGIDHDFAACVGHNPQELFNLEDVRQVVSTLEGTNGEEDWFWLFQISNGDYLVMQGGCDYTGWDCQSWAESYTVGDEVDSEALYEVMSDSNLAPNATHSDSNGLEIWEALLTQYNQTFAKDDVYLFATNGRFWNDFNPEDGTANTRRKGD